MNYICNWCGKEFELNKYQQSVYKKDSNKLLFCTRQCSGKFYAKKSHENKTEEQEQIRRNKISKALKEKEIVLTDEQKQKRIDNLNSYWKHMTNKERSERNKALANKAKQTKLIRYGSETYNNEEQRKQTNLERYGIRNTLRTDKAINNAKQVIQKRYNVNYFFSNREAFKNTSLDKYNTEHPMQNKEIKEKLYTTKLIKYGNGNFNNQDKFEQTFIKKYGVRRPFHLKKFVAKAAQTKYKNLKTEGIVSYGQISKINRRFADFIGSTDLEFPIDTYNYDVKLDNILIEIDPTFTHNCYGNKLYGKFNNVDIYYHYNKTKLAKDNGYRCIHVFDWDDWYKIKYLIQDKEILQARRLDCREVSKQECDDFLNLYHIQNTCRGQEIRIGLFTKENKLVQLMTFGKPRYNKNCQWELLRLCSHKDYKIIGGAKKLFTHFLIDYKPKSIVSYCDFGKFDGTVYNELGFKQFGDISLNKHWSKGSQHITDNLLRQRGYDQLFNTNYGKGTSNEQLMIENGWLPVYDCGQITYIWTNENL